MDPEDYPIIMARGTPKVIFDTPGDLYLSKGWKTLVQDLLDYKTR